MPAARMTRRFVFMRRIYHTGRPVGKPERQTPVDRMEGAEKGDASPRILPIDRRAPIRYDCAVRRESTLPVRDEYVCKESNDNDEHLL